MSIPEIILGSLLILVSLSIIVFVMMQKSREGGLSGAIAGGSSSDSFFGKNKGRTKEAKLAKVTKVLAIVLFVAVFAAWGYLKYIGVSGV